MAWCLRFRLATAHPSSALTIKARCLHASKTSDLIEGMIWVFIKFRVVVLDSQLHTK